MWKPKYFHVTTPNNGVGADVRIGQPQLHEPGWRGPHGVQNVLSTRPAGWSQQTTANNDHR